MTAFGSVIGRRALAAAILFSIAAGGATAYAQATNPAAVPGEAHGAGPTRATTIDVALIVGENKLFPAENVASYSIGAPGIVDVKVAPPTNGVDQFEIGR